MLASWMILLAACNSDTKVAAAKPNLALSVTELAFGDVVVDYPETRGVELLNGGLGPLDITDVTVDGDVPGVFAIGALPTDDLLSDDRFPLSVTFTPPDYDDYSATLTVTSNDDDSPHVVVLTGTGVQAPTPDVALDTLVLDYGTVAPLTTGVQWVTLSNEGDGPLAITGVQQLGSGSFSVQSDLTAAVLQPGQSQQVIVMYTPTTDQGDNGGLTITSNDPDEPVVNVTLIGNGGGDFEYPVAVIDGPAEAAPRDTLAYDGAGSYDPTGLEITSYEWTLVEVPDGSTAAESFTITTETAYLQTDLAGTYAVSLVVENSAGLRSAPAVWSVEAIPEEELHVELLWNTGSADLDLHLLTSDGEFFVEPYDCNFCNRTPSWGAIGEADDPRLDIDDVSGFGPENINIDTPADDRYTVMAHYYTENGDGDVTATVRVYLYGALASETSYALSRNDLWTVGEIRWPEGTFIESFDAPETPSRRTCE